MSASANRQLLDRYVERAVPAPDGSELPATGKRVEIRGMVAVHVGLVPEGAIA
jgi:hypothetical protein